MKIFFLLFFLLKINVCFSKDISDLIVAAEAGIPEAQYELAREYENGGMVNKSLGKARYWYEKSAKKGWKPAKEWLVKYNKNIDAERLAQQKLQDEINEKNRIEQDRKTELWLQEVREKERKKALTANKKIELQDSEKNKRDSAILSVLKNVAVVDIPGRKYKMMRHEVTFTQWDACAADGGCRKYKPSDEGWGRGNRPVINVNDSDAMAFATWLSQKTGKKFRLPTDDEWEDAADGGRWSTSFQCTTARFGILIGGECSSDSIGTVPVGSYAANAYGLFDVAGNVAEWTITCERRSECDLHVVKGGSWRDIADDVGSSAKVNSIVTLRSDDTGFRLLQE
jgi:hypothetical protein